MTKIDKIMSYLNELFSEAECALNFNNSYELLVAVILSAQCTDKRVNIVTKDLFPLANSPEKMLALGQERLKEIIHPCGFFNTKSKAIIETSQDLINRFDGKVPSTLDELTSLKGVGRKTANVVIANAFNGQTIAVDTHVHRVSKRLGLTSENSTPLKCEMNLLSVIPEDKRSKFHHQLILFGRNVCKAINPKCDECQLKNICKFYKYANTNKKSSKNIIKKGK